MTTYRKVAVQGFGWLAGFQIISAVISQVATILLATLLVPADFGLFSLAMISIALIAIPGDLGLTIELVRRENYDEVLPTALTLRWIIAAGLTVAALVSAPIAASLFGSPPLSLLIALLAVIFPAAALGFGPRVALTKALEFKVLATVDTLGRISGPLVSLGFALAGAGYWSLAFGMVISSWVTPIFLAVFHPVSPAGQFRRPIASSLVATGRFVSFSAIFAFLVSTGDNIAAVAGFGIVALGLYTFAYSLAVTIPRNIANMVETIVFPIFSKIVGDRERLKGAYLTTLRYVSYVAFPLAFGILVYSRAFVDLILGPQWQPIVQVMQTLAFAGLFYSLSVPASSALLAAGLARSVTRALATAFVVLAGGLGLALYLHAFEIVAGAATLAASVYLIVLQWPLTRRLSAGPKEVLGRVMIPAIASGLTAYIPFLILTLWHTGIASLILAVFCGLGLYVGLIELLSKGEFLKSVRELVTIISSR